MESQGKPPAAEDINKAESPPGLFPALRQLATPHQKFLLGFLLFCAVTSVFLSATHNDFVNLDDPDYVLNNGHVRTGLKAENIRWAFGSTESGNWHPLTWLSHMADCQLFGLNPARHHLVSILFHAANAVLLFLFLSQVTGLGGRSFFVAALFALHPLRVQSVAWIAERKDVLSTLFFMLTLWTYATYAQRASRQPPATNPLEARNPWPFFFYSLVFFALGLMSKPMLVSVPFVLLLLDFWPLNRLKPGSMCRLIIEKIPFFLAAAGACVVTLFAQKSSGAVRADLPLLLRAENAVISYARYLGKIFFPADLSVFYPHPRHWPIAWVVASLLVLLIVSTPALVQLRTRPYFAVGWLWFLGTLVPTIGLVQVGVQSIADRYTYVPGIGILLMFTWGSIDLLARIRMPHFVLPVAAASVLLLCSMLTRREITFWRDSESLFTRAIAVTKDNYMAHFYLGSTYDNQGRLDAAIAEFTEALRLRPNSDFCNTFGLFLERHGRLDQAVAQFKQAVELDPNFADPHHNLALALARKGRVDESIAEFQQALQLAPTNPAWHNDFGIALARSGRLEDAILHFQQALLSNPSSADFAYNLGNALFRKGRIDEAITQFEKALALNPASADVHNNLGIALTRRGRLNEAIQHFEEALRIKPGYPDAQRNLAAATALKEKQSAEKRN